MIDSQRAAGALVGSAVGDALGAPFEFGPAGAFSSRFPVSAPGGEMNQAAPLRAVPEPITDPVRGESPVWIYADTIGSAE